MLNKTLKTAFLTTVFSLSATLLAKEECPKQNPSTWSVDASLSTVAGAKHSIVKAVKNFGVPISLGLSQKKDKSAFFPMGQDIRFSYFRTRKVDSIADYYFLSWGLNYDRLWNLSFHLGYEILLVMFKQEIADNEVAITYHDFYLAPYLGVKKEIYNSSFLNFFAFGTIHMPTHAVRETFLELGLGGSIPL